jgi:hypothetical protein
MEKKESIIGKLFKGRKQKEQGLEGAAAAIIGLEQRLESKRGELYAAQKRMQSRFRDGVISGANTEACPEMATDIVTKQAECDALLELIQQATAEAVEMAKEVKGGLQAKYDALQAERDGLRREKDVKLFKLLTRLANRFDLNIKMPDKHHAGSMSIPTLLLEQEELDTIMAGVEAEPQDPDSIGERIANVDTEIGKVTMGLANSSEAWVQAILDRQRKVA